VVFFEERFVLIVLHV